VTQNKVSTDIEAFLTNEGAILEFGYQEAAAHPQECGEKGCLCFEKSEIFYFVIDGVTPSWYVRLGHTCRFEQGYDQTARW